jgi:formate dehydrogenase subunit gamma
MRPSPDTHAQLERFDRVERAAHWLNACVVLFLVATGAILYVPSLSAAVGQRLTVENSHVYVGLAVFLPVLIGVAGPWGARFRGDLREMRDLDSDEVAWLRTLGRQGRAAIGKFNPGQKLNTYAVSAMVVVLFVTGIVIRWANFLPVGFRTGATFIHDVFAILLSAVVLGHIAFALAHPASLKAMVTGRVPRSWASRHAPAWRVDAPAPKRRAQQVP